MTIPNGGPPITDEVPDMHYVKFFPGDFLNGTAHMSLELVGAYIRTLCIMYDRMGGFPYEEHLGAQLLRVDKRVYRRVREQLLADGKVFRDGDTIRNVRVEREISDYVLEYKRRSEAAKKREAERRQKQTSPELTPDLPRTSPELTPEVPPKFIELETEKPTITTDQEAREGDILESRSYKLEANKKERKTEGGSLTFAACAASPASDATVAFDEFNGLASRIGLPVARSLTPQRQKLLTARMREHGGLDAWRLALANIERSAFLQGRNDRGWRCDLDFLLTASKFSKVVEGTYGNGAHAKSQPQESYAARMSRLMGHGHEAEPETFNGPMITVQKGEFRS